MKKVLAWFFVIGILGIAAIGTTQLLQPTPLLLADDPKTGSGGG